METKLKPGINHIEFWISDIRQSMNFYNSFLSLIGWEQISDVSFSNGSTVVYFLEMKGVEKIRSLGVRHLCFQAMEKGQVDQVHAKLLTLQAEVIRSPRWMPYSKDYFTVDFYDPDGLIIEVSHTPYASMG